MAINFFKFIAEDTREVLASLGVRRLADVVGRVDLLEAVTGETRKQQQLDLSRLIHTDEFLESKPRMCTVERNRPFDKGETAETMVRELMPDIEGKTGGEYAFRPNTGEDRKRKSLQS